MSTPYFKKDVSPGKTYWWCACGLAAEQPLCDGTHKQQPDVPRPTAFEVDTAKTVVLCGCKKTNNPPYCDGSHATNG